MQHSKFEYPLTHEDDIVETFHGHAIADPYRWLEEPDSEATQAFIAAQNELTESYLSEIPARAQIQQRLTELWDYTKFSAPYKKGDTFFFWRQAGLQNQPVLYAAESLDAQPTIILDPNGLSEDGTVAVTGESTSPEGNFIAYRVSVHGSDQQTIHVRDVSTAHDLDEVLAHCRFSAIAWLQDESGFFYDRYPEPGTVPVEDEYNYSAIYFHRLNSPQSEDVKIFDRPDNKVLTFNGRMSDDNRYLILRVWHAAINKNRLYYLDLEEDNRPVLLIDTPDAFFGFIGNDGTTFYLQTNLDAPRSRIVAVDLDNPARSAWQTLIPESDGVISFVDIVADHFIVGRMENAHHRLDIFSLDGTHQRQVELPAIGTLLALTGRRQDDSFYINFHSYLSPPTVYQVEVATGDIKSLWTPQLPFEPAAFTTSQVWFKSKDGTPVSMFLTHKKGLVMDGNNPTWLYGYGGYSISLTPSFSPAIVSWIEAGGIYAVANLRGGNEYGEAWHQGGMLTNKQNVFDDFIGAAEWLIENQYSRPAKIAINGRSNGGLLTAACMVQRPDLFGAVLCGVPVIDMLRYHKFTAGKYWVAEYGDPDDKEQFDAMIAYSPLHNVKPGVTYPPTIIYTAESDDRVVPMHTLKFGATVQKADSGVNPILVRIDTKSGHGLGKPTAKVIEEYADLYAFAWRILEMG